MSEIETWVDRLAARIHPHMASAVESIVAVGTELEAARAEALHGAWNQLCARLGFTTRTAHRLREIAKHPVLSNRTHASHLPAAWTTLYELSKHDPDLLERAIAGGHVTPELGRGQAQDIPRRVTLPELSWPETKRPGSKVVPTIYIDGHGVGYEKSLPIEEVEAELSDESHLGWQLDEDHPAGPTYIWRRPRRICHSGGMCPLCAQLVTDLVLP